MKKSVSFDVLGTVALYKSRISGFLDCFNMLQAVS